MKINKFGFSIGVVLTATFVTVSCTDLEVKEKDSAIIESSTGAFTGVNPTASLASAYGDINGYGDQANLYAMLEVTSDELLVPTRGTDWGDNGVWRVLHTHEWDATHGQILTTWNNLNSNVYRLNQLLAPESEASDVQLAEGKFLRALNMFYIFDLWRQIPNRDVNDKPTDNPVVLSGEEAFNFIVNDLTEALDDLPTITAGAEVAAGVRASQASAHFLLAKLLLNKHIYLNTTVSAADMTAVIGHVDAIEADGFALAGPGEYFNIFKNTADPETIFWANTCVCNRMWNGLHYNHVMPGQLGGWNGFSTTAEFYDLFEGDPDSNFPGSGQEERRGYVPNTVRAAGIRDVDGAPGVQPAAYLGYGFLLGQQYNDAGEKLKDRPGTDLILTKDFPGLAGNNEKHGMRILKYHPDNGEYASGLVLFRYADAHLMKIEAILRGGTSGDNAQTLLDELRTARGVGSVPATLDEILDERGRELYIEGWRRNDQVRFGTFTQPFTLMENTEAFRIVFPLPASAVSSNPNLVQNEGY